MIETDHLHRHKGYKLLSKSSSFRNNYRISITIIMIKRGTTRDTVNAYIPPLDIIWVIIPVVFRLLRVDVGVDTSFAGQRHDNYSLARVSLPRKQRTQFRMERDPQTRRYGNYVAMLRSSLSTLFANAVQFLALKASWKFQLYIFR